MAALVERAEINRCPAKAPICSAFVPVRGGLVIGRNAESGVSVILSRAPSTVSVAGFETTPVSGSRAEIVTSPDPTAVTRLLSPGSLGVTATASSLEA